ncbi:MAG: glycoside hydrolase family 2 protein [Erysipelotrichaceae bacterium]|nr:glycoside hydrolase family 2 protein [Erysipelotrichaceae bacterium]
MKKRINDQWEYVPVWTEAFFKGEEKGQEVWIPHSVAEMPLHYSDRSLYEGIRGYRKKLTLPEGQKGKRAFLIFEGAAHIATLYVNGEEVLTHRNGYTSFRAEITTLLKEGENDIVVKLDTSENPEVPPFGFAIDYLTFGGIYRNVWLETREENYVSDVFAYAQDLETLCVETSVEGEAAPISYTLLDGGQEVASLVSNERKIQLHFAKAVNWTPETPKLYTLVTKMGEDVTETDVAFRTVDFNETGLLLNGKPYFFRGLNRHQSYPWLGYAAADRLQIEDARILKEELGCNAVRTSHYPQSHAFLKACDELGLLVFTEIPGWQHIGDSGWQKQAVINTEEMVKEYRNHPSIFLWGVRINESLDNDDLYLQTNQAAHALDPSRKTSGVRYIEKSSLLEDVYSYNDFSHDGKTPGCKPKKDITPDMKKALLISEANGHMFPTKPYDTWQKRQEHALRHARVLNAAMADKAHAGVFQWCMFDYATHQDFGSGDRICYHGVLDSFRNPKLAAAVYASQSDNEPVLEVSSSMDAGDYSAAQIGEVYAFSNADEVRLYKNDHFVTSFRPKEFSAMKHGPICIDDTIGNMLEEVEGFSKEKAAIIRECLLAAGKYGMANLPAVYKAKLAWCMLKYKMSYKDGVDLYGKYIGNWGGKAVVWRYAAVKDGKVVKEVVKAPSAKLHLEVKHITSALKEEDGYDADALRIRVLDEYGNLAVYGQLPVSVKTEGVVELDGPAVLTAEGGSTGTYLHTVGKNGSARVTISAPQCEDVVIDYTVEGAKE